MTQLVQRAASDWLTLRRPADESARTATLPLLESLNRHLSAHVGSDGSVAVVDLGAGTGANMAWLGPRLSVPQRWTLIDRDEDLLGLVPVKAPPVQVLWVQRLAVELEHLQSHHGGGRTPDLVTCSAFLDVLTLQQVRDLCGFVVRTGAAALFSLTVDGTVSIAPATDLDYPITEAFNAHQGRHGLAGPSGATVAAEVLRHEGYTVHIVGTPWVLASTDAPLVERYLTERVAASIDQDALLTEAALNWLSTRLSQLVDGELTVEVGHLDLVAFPPSS